MLFSNDIKAVLFDHDDTLVGTIEAKWRQHKYVAKTFYGKELTDEELKEHWGKPLHELILLLYETDDVEEAMKNNLSCHEAYPKRLFDATCGTLEKLHENGVLTGVITATSRKSFEHDLLLHKINDNWIDYTQAAEDSDFHKPDPRVFEPTKAWLANKQVRPHEVVYVGDGLHDMRAAIGAGFQFVGVQTGLVGADEFASAGARSISGLADLLQTL